MEEDAGSNPVGGSMSGVTVFSRHKEGSYVHPTTPFKKCLWGVNGTHAGVKYPKNTFNSCRGHHLGRWCEGEHTGLLILEI